MPYGGFSQLSSGGSTQLFTISRQLCEDTAPFQLPTASTWSVTGQAGKLSAFSCGDYGGSDGGYGDIVYVYLVVMVMIMVVVMVVTVLQGLACLLCQQNACH